MLVTRMSHTTTTGRLRTLNSYTQTTNFIHSKTINSMKTYQFVHPNVPEAVSNPIEILNKVEIHDICRTLSLHVFPIPNASGENQSQREADYLENLTFTKAR